MDVKTRRSQCPIVFALDLLGDRWTLLVVRDLLFRRASRFRDFLDAGEGIATNILADRLAKLADAGVVTKEVDAAHGKRFVYRLTDRGRELAPILLELIRWSHHHDPDTVVAADYAERIEHDRDSVVAELLSRREGDGS